MAGGERITSSAVFLGVAATAAATAAFAYRSRLKEVGAKAVAAARSYSGRSDTTAAAALVERLRAGLPQTRNLTSNEETQGILDLAAAILGSSVPLAEVSSYVYPRTELPANLVAAVKVTQMRQLDMLDIFAAEGYAALAACPPCHVTVVFAMYHEQRRMQKFSAENPNGQDFVRNKCLQLRWLFAANEACTWDLLAVDDGCDEGSGASCEKVIAEAGLGDVARVAYLQAGIDGKARPFDLLRTTKDSRKGGSILYGLHEAAARRAEHPNQQHIVIYTDADLSMDLAQSGLLVHSCLVKGHLFASAARYGYPRSFLVTDKGARGHPESHMEQPNVVHIAVRHFLRQHLLPDIAHLYDTNVGFKAFYAKDLPELLPDMTVFGPAFDMELLLRALRHYRRRSGRSAEEVVGVEPVLFVEDFAESNFTSNATNPDATNEGFLRMAREIAEMSASFGPDGAAADPRYKTVLKLAKGIDLAGYRALIAGLEKTMGRRLSFGTDFTEAEIEEAIRAGGDTGGPRW